MTVQEEVTRRIAGDPLLIKLRRKIDSGTADFKDTAAYSNRAADIMSEIFARRLPEISLAERETLCVELLHDRHTDINELLGRVQRSLDDAQGLHIAPQHAPFNAERAHQIGSSTADPTKPEETRQRRARSATATAARAMHDDYIRKNADFRSKAGLKCYINREAVPACCEWCTKMAGRYVYGEEPDDIYRRHDNCGCSVTFENGRKRQDVWSKREWEAPAEGAGAGAPVNFIGKEVPQKDLTILSKNGTMKSSGTGVDEGQHWFEQITTIDPSDKKAAAQLLRDFERQYAESQIEHCRVITAAGEVYDVHGGRWTVDTTLLGEKMRGSTNEHNHVTGESQYSFSWEDLSSCAEDGSKFAIAFDEKYRYTMVFPDVLIDSDAVYNAYCDAANEVGEINALSYQSGNGKQILDEDCQHEIIRRACERLGVLYERKRKT